MGHVGIQKGYGSYWSNTKEFMNEGKPFDTIFSSFPAIVSDPYGLNTDPDLDPTLKSKRIRIRIQT